ncbi:tetrahydrofolate synthase [Weissella oryzae SG25]|uniref:tetrahydrofolate synthase n=1 Tax=Weissella oryzae (strain DSM 25784 / JCM 18191 / LMG 30913 / SG25) TaxID=1329250 RepID=A0A069CZP2_WEIOS|nr:folylpolyglutamate synthase/dihydrofolate synthase family protein [Weissella oryzae]GAK30576.1 tetrahydrofolate synthase [Weissella oryzae SG25]
MIKTYAEAINFIHGRSKWKKTPSFQRIETLLARLGNPHLQAQYVHITGTNGKGSTSKMLAQILRQANLSVGLFTSPYIMRFNERIQDDAGPIRDERLLALMQEIAPVVSQLDQEGVDAGPTEFETLTALMFLYFARYPVDVVILEVGIGGLWDTTNVVPASNKLATAITSISYDHQKILGKTLAEITTQKVGILRRGVPLVLGTLPAEAQSVVNLAIEKLNLEAAWLGHDFFSRQVGQEHGQQLIDFQGRNHFRLLPLNLQGSFQVANAGVALRLAEIVLAKYKLELTENQVINALSTVSWPARFETLKKQPQLIIDGAHNVAGVEQLAQTIRENFAEQPIQVIFGALTDKEYRAMLQILVKLPQVQLAVAEFQAPGSRQAVSAPKLDDDAALANILVYPDWRTALAATKPDQPTIITGSLYFVSEVRAGVFIG